MMPPPHDPDYVVAPYAFERAAPGAKIAADWEPNTLTPPQLKFQVPWFGPEPAA